jgi:hypothetical protein
MEAFVLKISNPLLPTLMFAFSSKHVTGKLLDSFLKVLFRLWRLFAGGKEGQMNGGPATACQVRDGGVKAEKQKLQQIESTIKRI